MSRRRSPPLSITAAILADPQRFLTPEPGRSPSQIAAVAAQRGHAIDGKPPRSPSEIAADARGGQGHDAGQDRGQEHQHDQGRDH